MFFSFGMLKLLTSFATCSGYFEFHSMPFGVAMSPINSWNGSCSKTKSRSIKTTIINLYCKHAKKVGSNIVIKSVTLPRECHWLNFRWLLTILLYFVCVNLTKVNNNSGVSRQEIIELFIMMCLDNNNCIKYWATSFAGDTRHCDKYAQTNCGSLPINGVIKRIS